MKIFENSNLVNWEEYPEYVCGVVSHNVCDLRSGDLVMPKGTEFVCLFDKEPEMGGGGIIFTDTNYLCLDGIILPNNGCSEYIRVLELHLKPKEQRTLQHVRLETVVLP